MWRRCVPKNQSAPLKAVVALSIICFTFFIKLTDLFIGKSSVITNLSPKPATQGVEDRVQNITKWEQLLVETRKYYSNPFQSRLQYNKDVYDILNVRQPQFDSAYKNPCWVGTETNGPIADGKFHCLPYLFIIGVKKSGTTELFRKLSRHPEFVPPDFKESQWLPRMRWGITSKKRPRESINRFKGVCRDVRSVECFISLFDDAAQNIYRSPSLITAEGTPAHLHIHTNWHLLPGNEGLPEPKYTNYHYLDHISPKAKIIVIFRDPVTRLYSDFWHTNRKRNIVTKTSDDFHDQVTRITEKYSECFSRWSMRRCIYNETLRNNLIMEGTHLAESFMAGFYAFYMTEMINVFGRNRIYPVLTNDCHDDLAGTLSKLFHFLGISQLSPSKMSKLVKQSVVKKYKYDAMLNKSRDVLYSFYEPFNRQMADLMKDDRYLFQKPE